MCFLSFVLTSKVWVVIYSFQIFISEPEVLSAIFYFPAFNCYGCTSDTSPTPEGIQTCINSPENIPENQGRIIGCNPAANDTKEWVCYTVHILEKGNAGKFYVFILRKYLYNIFSFIW